MMCEVHLTVPGAPAIIRAYPLADAQLSICLTDNLHTRSIVDGLVKPDGVDLMVSTAAPPELFWRQLNFAEFDISGMSCSSLVIAVANGDARFVAIPVFATRSFFHTRTQVRADSGIERPEELRDRIQAARWIEIAVHSAGRNHPVQVDRRQAGCRGEIPVGHAQRFQSL